MQKEQLRELQAEEGKELPKDLRLVRGAAAIGAASNAQPFAAAAKSQLRRPLSVGNLGNKCTIKIKKCNKNPKSLKKCKKTCNQDAGKTQPLCQKTCCTLGFTV